MASPTSMHVHTTLQSYLPDKAGIPSPSFDTENIALPATCPLEGCSVTKTFTRKSEFKKHLDKHLKPYTCTHASCPTTPHFSSRGDLRRHENEKHTQPQYFCPLQYCPRHTRGFSRRRNRDVHFRTCHGSRTTSVVSEKENDKAEGSEERLTDGKDGGRVEGVGFGKMEIARVREGGETDRLGLKLKEPEARELELGVQQARLREDIEAIKRAMLLVSA